MDVTQAEGPPWIGNLVAWMADAGSTENRELTGNVPSCNEWEQKEEKSEMVAAPAGQAASWAAAAATGRAAWAVAEAATWASWGVSPEEAAAADRIIDGILDVLEAA